MKGDLAAKLHHGIYGKSDKLNSKDNQSPYFKAGYDEGMKRDLKTSIAVIIPAEWRRRGEPDFGTNAFEDFREWKRGFSAARMQRTVASIPTR